jgi:hypothetical protein
MLKNEVSILDPAVLPSMRTRELLARLRRLHRCEDSASLSDASPEELARVTGILFKDTSAWKSAYLALKQVLASREHVAKGAETRVFRVDRAHRNRTAEHRRRR